MLGEFAASQNNFSANNRRYWADAVTQAGKETIRRIHMERSRSYKLYADSGFYAVGDIPQQNQGVYKDLKPYQRRIVRSWAAQERIARMEEEDLHTGVSREYVSVDGAVRPRRGRKWKEIAQEEHVFWQPDGVTILARDVHRPSLGDREAAVLGLPFAYDEKAIVMAYAGSA